MPRHHSLCSAKVSLVFGDRLTLLQNDVQKEMHVLQRYRWAHCPERLQSGQQCPRCVLLLLCELFTHYPQPSFSVSICAASINRRSEETRLLLQVKNDSTVVRQSC